MRDKRKLRMIFEITIWDWIINGVAITFLVVGILVVLKLLQEIWDNWKFDRYLRDKNKKFAKGEKTE